jgi:outer membrane protein OmpA-like peptidoglycan-associated protein
MTPNNSCHGFHGARLHGARLHGARIHGVRFAAHVLCAVTCAWPVWTLAQAPAANQAAPATVTSSEEILQALTKPKAPPTRGLSFQPTRGLQRREESVSEPSVNLNIPFEFNSSALKPQASEQLKQLELALVSPAVGHDRFIVAGHTDAKGSAEYNKQLSLRRAETVKHFLVEKGLDPKRLDAIGYGSEKPLSPDHPDDPGNRRVEIRAVAAP